MLRVALELGGAGWAPGRVSIGAPSRRWSSARSSRASSRGGTRSRKPALRNGTSGRRTRRCGPGGPRPPGSRRSPCATGRTGSARRDSPPGGGRIDRVIADLHQAVRVAADLGAEHPRDHLGTETDPEQRSLGREAGALDPVELRPDPRQMIVVGALRPAEHHSRSVGCQILRQRVTQVRTAPVERAPARLEQLADPPGGRVLLMNHDQNLLGHPLPNARLRPRDTAWQHGSTMVADT